MKTKGTPASIESLDVIDAPELPLSAPKAKTIAFVQNVAIDKSICVTAWSEGTSYSFLRQISDSSMENLLAEQDPKERLDQDAPLCLPNLSRRSMKTKIMLPGNNLQHSVTYSQNQTVNHSLFSIASRVPLLGNDRS
jgi:hypothetical protein